MFFLFFLVQYVALSCVDVVNDENVSDKQGLDPAPAPAQLYHRPWLFQSNTVVPQYISNTVPQYHRNTVLPQAVQGLDRGIQSAIVGHCTTNGIFLEATAPKVCCENTVHNIEDNWETLPSHLDSIHTDRVWCWLNFVRNSAYPKTV